MFLQTIIFIRNDKEKVKQEINFTLKYISAEAVVKATNLQSTTECERSELNFRTHIYGKYFVRN